MARPATAQTSVYSVLGLGTPGRTIGVRARALGGGVVALDPASAVNPAAIAAFRGLSAAVTSTSSYRGYSIGDATVDGLSDTRFAHGGVGGPFGGTPLSFALTFGLYLDRTFDVEDTSTIVLRGDTLQAYDEMASDGAIVDLRGAVGWQVSRSLRLGFGLHLLTGSTENAFSRQFSDGAYASISREDVVSFNGVGFAGGIMWTPSQRWRFGGSLRYNTDLTGKLDGTEIGRTRMPLETSAGVFFAPVPWFALTSTVMWRSWSRTKSHIAAPDFANAFDSWEIGTGAELIGRLPVPIRLGFRWAQLPYSSTSEQPREIDFAIGTGLPLAQGRASFDFALERAMRDGGGATERAWQMSFEFRVFP